MWKTLNKLYDLLDARERRRALLLLGMILIMGIIETTSVASVMPFVAVLTHPGTIESNQYLSAAYRLLGFQQTATFLLFLGLIVLVTVVGSTAFKALTTWAMLRFTSMRQYTVSRRLFKSFLYRPYYWFFGQHSADLGRTVLSEVAQVITGALIPTMQMAAQGVVVILLIALLLVVDPVLAFTVSLVLGGAYALVFWATHQYVRRIGLDRVRANQERFRVSNEAFSGIKEVKVLGVEQVFLRRFENPSLRFAKHQAASQILSQLPQYALQAVAVGGILLIVQYQLLVRGSQDQALPLIAVYAFAGYRLLPALQRLYQSISTLRFAQPALDHLHGDLEYAVSHVGGKKADASIQLPQLEHSLELRDVCYRYPGSATIALRNVTMIIPARSMVGLVGRTGAGKTTAVDVILGLLQPQSGHVLADGRPIIEENRRAWQRRVGYVPQHIFLAADTLAANIAFGVPLKDIDLAAVERASRIANLHSFVLELKQGYDTLVGERGIRLSGGQRQRVAIARALYRDPDVIVMDEATSALDNVTERAVMEAVGNLGHQKTIIIVAHRLTTVQRCDKIFLFEDGRTVASGSYRELVNGSEPFRAMVDVALD
jgi:ABC-type bacteriocin/lantibiotic exporter with double-glycine peptidase domain